MDHIARLRSLSALVATTSLVAACGGGGSDDPPAPPPPAPASVSGTAAVGAALANAQVSVTDASKASVCTEAAIVTTGAGSFTCTMVAGKAAPFLVVVTDPSGAYAPLLSIVASTPQAGTPLIVNATPLTTAIVAQLSPSGDALALVADPTLMNVDTLNSVRTNVLAQLAPTLAALGAPAGYDPFSTPITAATASQNGNTADRVIETLKFSSVNGVTTVATIDNPAGAVALAGATTANPPALPAPSATIVTLADALRLLSNALTNCFALPVSQRVLATDTTIATSAGGPEVTSVADACDEITHPDYLTNGFSAGQQFYGLLNDAAMVGAKFNPPEVMRFIDDTTAADNDRVILNLRYTDANGVAGNIITLGQKFPGSSTADRQTDWWLYGNQQPVDTSIQAFVRRSDQRVPNPGTAPFANAGASRYESGLNLFINKDGPGSAGMRAARVKGPGLPPAGVVLTRPDPAVCTDQNWLNIRRKDGNTDPAAATFASAGNIFRLQRTIGLSGADATTLRLNPNGGNTNTTAFPDWAHPLDYGAAVGATNYIDYSQLSANIAYTVELYYDGETAPRYTLTKTLLSPVIPATRGANLQWIALTQGTLDYLDPANALAAAQPSMNLAWAANPFAETVRSAGVYTFAGGASVNQGQVPVMRGATSTVANAPGNVACVGGSMFSALTDDGNTSRAIQLRYRMLDGSFKDAFARWN